MLSHDDPLPSKPRTVAVAGVAGTGKTTFPRVLRRTVKRRLKREVLWNGNIEPPLLTFFTDPAHIVRWAISSRAKYREQVPGLELACPHVTIVRLCSQREVEQWLEGPLLRALGDGR